DDDLALALDGDALGRLNGADDQEGGDAVDHQHEEEAEQDGERAPVGLTAAVREKLALPLLAGESAPPGRAQQQPERVPEADRRAAAHARGDPEVSFRKSDSRLSSP